jgi:hypothetical protein
MTAMENSTSSQTNGPASPNSAHTSRIARRDFLRAAITGGCALHTGICEVAEKGELAEKVLGLPAQRACAKGLSGPARLLANPGLACALGLAKLGHTEC